MSSVTEKALEGRPLAADGAATAKYYGGTITTKGRDLITSLIAGGTIEFTRVMVGNGRMPEGIEPIDMEGLVSPVAAAVSTVPILENGVMSLVVEYRNDLNGGLETGFWLSEFAIYAKTADTPEICLYYATLGDSPQPVNAYKDNRVDIRRFPVTIALELDANVEVTYNPGAFMTASEVEELVDALIGEALDNASSTKILDITIPRNAWAEVEEDIGEEPFDGMDEYRYYADVVVAGITEDQFPAVALYREALPVARDAGVCPTAQSFTGYLRFWARNEPLEDMAATVALFTQGATGGAGGGGKYVLPVATTTTLGGVKIGSGISVEKDGTISSEGKVAPEQVASVGDAEEMLDEIYGSPDEATPGV